MIIKGQINIKLKSATSLGLDGVVREDIELNCKTKEIRLMGEV